MEVGASFLHRHKTFNKIKVEDSIKQFSELGLTWIRIGCYWSDIEKVEGTFDFSEIEYLIKCCQRYNLKILLIVGMKAPDWPEYYIPDWLTEKSRFLPLHKINDGDEQLAKSVLKFVEKSVTTFRDNPVIKVWQIENEPFDPSGGRGWKISCELLEREIELVKESDPQRKILVNIWANELTLRGNYKTAMNIADIVGMDIYPKIPPPFFKLFKKYIGPLDSTKRITNIIKEINNSGKKMWITELQASPWEPSDDLFNSENPPSFNVQQFAKNFEIARHLDPEVLFLWGFEYWIYRKALGDNRYWDEARRLININKQL